MTEFISSGRASRSKKETRSVYERLSRVYSLLTATEGPLRTKAVNMLAAGKGESVLEIGFGTGEVLAALTYGGAKVTGIDLSLGMAHVAAAKIRRKKFAGQINLSVGDAEILPYPDCWFDAIFMSFTLELFESPEIPRVLAECSRVLRPHGRLCVAGMSLQAQSGIMVKIYNWFHQSFPKWIDCRPIPLKAYIDRSGFVINSVWTCSTWGLPVMICVAEKPD